MHNAKSRAALLLLALPLALFSVPKATASFSSIYVFGDGVCTTTGNASASSLYYGKRFCNGRIWIEVLSQWQGLNYAESKNQSFYGHDSQVLLTSINNFATPADAGTALFIVWCDDADFVEFAQTDSPPYSASHNTAWTNFINQSIATHVTAVTNLYNKGARTLVMPKAVNVAKTPYFNMTAADIGFMAGWATQFNTAFDSALAALAASHPGLTIYRPDTYSLFESATTNPAAYGLINPTRPDYPNGIDAVDHLGNPSLSGPGANYVFWDDLNPSAKFQMFLADLVQQMISPAKVGGLSLSGGTVQMQIGNVPLGRAGIVEGSNTLQAPWQQEAAVSLPFAAGGSTTTAVSFPASGSRCYYRVGFPVVWTWP